MEESIEIKFLSGNFDKEDLRLCCKEQEEIKYLEIMESFEYQTAMDKIKGNTLSSMEILSIIVSSNVV